MNDGDMPRDRIMPVWRILKLLVGLLIVRVVIGIVLVYRDYFPPDFESDFLSGRDAYFYSSYRWAFYAHILVSPCALLLGLLGISDRFRLSFPTWHRRLGRVQASGVLFVVAPSGFWMASRAEGGPIAVSGFATLALVTGTCVALGWRAAIRRQFAEHRRWMWRSFLLLSSAVVLRLTVGLAAVTGIETLWLEPINAWTCWMLPLGAFELIEQATKRLKLLYRLPTGNREQGPTGFDWKSGRQETDASVA
jgi:uncharacterized membrane protein YozB (DUF420 family)